MIDYTERICQTIGASLAQLLIFDTSDNKLYVTESNPKNLYALVKKLKTFYKDNPNVAPYKVAYDLMSPKVTFCPDAKLMFINELSVMLINLPFL